MHRRFRSALGKAALLVASASLPLYAFEVWLALRQNETVRLRAVERLRGDGVAAFPSLMPSLFVRHRWHPGWAETLPGGLLPLGGISRAMTVECGEGRKTLAFRSDEHGFLNTEGAWAAPVDVVVLGDSYVRGVCVDGERNMVARVRQHFPHTLNLGNSGNGPLASLATLREYVPELRPRVVVWVYFAGNDLSDLQLERRHPVLARYLDPSFRQGLRAAQDQVDRGLASAYEAAAARRPRPAPRLQDMLLLRHLRRRFWPGPRPPAPPLQASAQDWELFREVLAQVARTGEGMGAPVLFVYMPEWRELFARQPWHEPMRQRVLEAAAGERLTVLDLSGPLARAGPEAYACPYTCHLDELGYALAGDAVAAALAAPPVTLTALRRPPSP